MTLDIDHAFPWSVWPRGDLWNLLPAHRSVNQHKKRQKLPTDRLLLSQRDEILSWCRDAYERTGHLASQFAAEAREPAFARRRGGRGVRRGLRRHACPAAAAMARPANTRVERVIRHDALALEVLARWLFIYVLTYSILRNELSSWMTLAARLKVNRSFVTPSVNARVVNRSAAGFISGPNALKKSLMQCETKSDAPLNGRR